MLTNNSFNGDLGVSEVEQGLDSTITPYLEYGFKYREMSKRLSEEEQLAYINTVAYNAIFFQLAGDLRISWGRHKDVRIGAGDMYFLPRGATVSACITSDYINYVVVRLEHNIDNSSIFGDLSRVKDMYTEEEYRFAPLAMKPAMMSFSSSVKEYMKQGVCSPQLFSLKISEMQIVLRLCYSSAECINFFYPIVGFVSEFEQFVLDSYQTSTSIEELASKAHMSRSTFDRKFKEVFNTTPLKWIDEQIRQCIVQKSSEPNVTVKDIMYEVGIYNSSQFTRLCRRLCGVTPSELIRLR